MPTKIRTEAITLEVIGDVTLDGATLPIGKTFHGELKQIGMSGYGGISWADPEYRLKLSADDMHHSDLHNYNVSKFVKSGDIRVYH